MGSKTARQRNPDWLKSRKELLSQAKAQVALRLGPLPRDLEAVQSTYMARRWDRHRILSKADLFSALSSARLVLSGDFHAHGSSQRMHLKLLRAISNHQKNWTLVLECFQPAANIYLKQYLKGELSLDELQVSSRFDQRWGFSFDHYRPLLEEAKRRQFQVVGFGLELRGKSRASLVRQDLALAERLKAHLAHPKAAVFCVVGELHLEGLGKHFPDFSTVSLYSNSEKLYFSLAEKGLEAKVEVVEFPESRFPKHRDFGLICSPPWVPWQSYLYHLEHLEDAQAGSEFDPSDLVRTQARWLLGELGHPVTSDALEEHFAGVIGVEDRRVNSELLKARKKLSRLQSLRLRTLVKNQRTVWVPELGAGFLGESNINSIAALAMEWIHTVTSARTRTLTTEHDDFFALVWSNAISFLGSKLVNHKRAAPSVYDLEDELKSVTSDQLRMKSLELTLRVRLIERSSLTAKNMDQSLGRLFHMVRSPRPSKFQARRAQSTISSSATLSSYPPDAREAAALITGRMFGERLYLLYRHGGLKKAEVAELLQAQVLRKDFLSVYTKWVRRVDSRLKREGISREAVRKADRL